MLIRIFFSRAVVIHHPYDAVISNSQRTFDPGLIVTPALFKISRGNPAFVMHAFDLFLIVLVLRIREKNT